jgi:hypothetical protein
VIFGYSHRFYRPIAIAPAKYGVGSMLRVKPITGFKKLNGWFHGEQLIMKTSIAFMVIL